MRQIRILYIIGSLEIGGSQRNLIQILENIDRTRFKPYVLCLYKKGGWFNRIKELAVETYLHTYKKRIFDIRGLRSLIRLSQRCRQEKIDIIQTYGFGCDVFGAALRKVSGIRHLIAGKRNAASYSRRYLPMVRFANYLSSRICVNSYKLLEQLAAYEKFDINKAKVIYNGIDAKLYDIPMDRVEARESLGLPKEGYIIGTVANFYEKKGYAFLLEAFRRVSDSHKDVYLLMAGTGPLSEDIKGLSKKLGVERNCVFLGKREDIPQILAALDTFVLFSIREGMSNALLEAMAAGKPCVVADVGANAELIRDGFNGFVATPQEPAVLADRIQRLLADKDLASQMGLANRGLVQNFSVDRMIGSYQNLYSELIGGGVWLIIFYILCSGPLSL